MLVEIGLKLNQHFYPKKNWINIVFKLLFVTPQLLPHPKKKKKYKNTKRKKGQIFRPTRDT